jgi:hypothetical protein
MLMDMDGIQEWLLQRHPKAEDEKTADKSEKKDG